MSKPQFALGLDVDPATGQLLSLQDPQQNLEFLRFAAGTELELNGRPLATRLQTMDAGRNEHITTLEARCSAAYGAGHTLRIRRLLTRGGSGLRTGAPNSLHLRYEIMRVPHTAIGEGLDYIWQPELEAPLRLDTLGVLCAPAMWFGEGTRMRVLAIGGSGPREHVSLEDGPVAEIVPYLQTAFRTTFPGQQTVIGALYYHPSDERFVWVIARRPTTGGRSQYGVNRHAYQFYYFHDMAVNQECTTPAVSFFWGRGLANADRVLAEQFDLFEEPPAWWYKSMWFWLHPIWQPGGNFEAMGQGAEILMDQAGVNGFGMAVHDVPWSGNDIDVGSPRPCPRLGGGEGLRRAVERIRNKGGHTYIWISRHGHRPDTIGFQESWNIYGVDGRPIRLQTTPDAGVYINIINPADPTFQEYILRWVEYYVKQVGVTGLFWDSGLQPLPPDFGNKPYLRHPGQTLAWPAEFYEKVYQFGKSLNPDFFMWVEGISVDAPMNAFAVDNRMHGINSAHPLMHRLAHAGPKRLVWRSAWPHDVASGFPFCSPPSDIGWQPEAARYAAVAADPMNRWLGRIVQERGVRHAVGLTDGVSLLDELVVACPGIKGSVLIPRAQCRGEALEHVISKALIRGVATPEGVRFDLPESGGYSMK